VKNTWVSDAIFFTSLQLKHMPPYCAIGRALLRSIFSHFDFAPLRCNPHPCLFCDLIPICVWFCYVISPRHFKNFFSQTKVAAALNIRLFQFQTVSVASGFRKFLTRRCLNNLCAFVFTFVRNCSEQFSILLSQKNRDPHCTAIFEWLSCQAEAMSYLNWRSELL